MRRFLLGFQPIATTRRDTSALARLLNRRVGN